MDYIMDFFFMVILISSLVNSSLVYYFCLLFGTALVISHFIIFIEHCSKNTVDEKLNFLHMILTWATCRPRGLFHFPLFPSLGSVAAYRSIYS